MKKLAGDWLAISVISCAVLAIAARAFQVELDAAGLGRWPIAFALLTIAAVLAIRRASDRTKQTPARFQPAGIVALTAAVVWFVPVYLIGVEYEFWRYGSLRELVVQDVESGKLQPISRPGFPLRYAIVMDGLSEVSAGACGAPRDVCVEFAEFPGFLGGYSGFLYVPDGGDPRRYVEGNPSYMARHWSGNWFFVSQ